MIFKTFLIGNRLKIETFIFPTSIQTSTIVKARSALMASSALQQDFADARKCSGDNY